MSPGLTQHVQTGQETNRPGPQIVRGKVIDPGVYSKKARNIRLLALVLESILEGVPGNLRPLEPIRFWDLLCGQYVRTIVWPGPVFPGAIDFLPSPA